MLNREHATELIEAKLGSQRLIWIGYHGLDVAPLRSLPQFSHCYSYGVPAGDDRIEDVSIEQRFGVRRLNQTSWGNTLAFQAICETLLPACEVPSVIAAFIPLPFFEFIQQERPAARYLGTPWEQFQLLNTKVHVEEQLRRVASDSLKFIDWRTLPVGSSRADLVRAEVRRRSIVLRASFAQAGLGHELIQDEDDLAASRLLDNESLSLGPYLKDHLPLAVGGCVFPDGEATLHLPSIQLTGLPHCSTSPFGYCGNDFGAIKQLDRRVLDELELVARTVARWLHTQGYIGAFGIDAMLYDGQLLYTELNPRFLGSTWHVSRMEAQMGIPDMVQDHLMAWLGIASHRSPPLTELVAAQPSRSHVVVCNRDEERASVLADQLALPDGVGIEMVPAAHVLVDPADPMFTLVFDRSVTEDGHSLDPEVAAVVESAMRNVQLRGQRLRPRRSGTSRHHD